MDKESLAKELYKNYSLSLEENQLLMPDWDELSDKERIGWVAVAGYVIMDICL